MSDAPSCLGAPSFRLGHLEIVGHRLGDGTPVISADQVIALLELTSRPTALASLDLSELQRLEDWIRSTTPPSDPAT